MTLRCDLILVTWNHLDHTKRCVESILRGTSVPYRLTIVDNGSTKDTLDFLDALEARHPERIATVRNQDNLGWVKAANEGMRRAVAPYVCLLNNDLIVIPGWLEAMLKVAEANPAIGLVNPTYNRCGEPFDEFSHRMQSRQRTGRAYEELNECNGACLLIRREVREALGGLDEVYGFGGIEDYDYSRRAEVAGFRCVRAHDACVFHKENVSFNTLPKYWTEERRRNQQVFVKRWGERKQIAVVLGDAQPEPSVRLLQQCLALARLGVRIHLWGVFPRDSALSHVGGRWQLGIAEHNNLKLGVWRRPSGRYARLMWVVWLGVVAAAVGLGRRWKAAPHRIRAFIVPTGHSAVWMKCLRWMHGASVYRRVDQCPVVEREVSWARGIDTMPW